MAENKNKGERELAAGVNRDGGGAMARARKLGGESRKRPYSARFSTGKARGGRGG